MEKKARFVCICTSDLLQSCPQISKKHCYRTGFMLFGGAISNLNPPGQEK